MDVGLGLEGEEWKLALFDGCSSETFSRLVRRSVECSGGAETLDFFVSLADPANINAGEFRLMVDSLNFAFSRIQQIEWSLVIPERLWMDRLSLYHNLTSSSPLSIPEGETMRDLSAAINGMELACHRIEPRGVLDFLASYLYGFTPPSYPLTVEGFTAHVSENALLVTADARVFAAWQDIVASPAVCLLPEGWEMCLAKYGSMLARALPHFSIGQPFAGEVGMDHVISVNS